MTSDDVGIFGRMTGPRFLLVILGFFVVVFAANGALIYYAVSGFSGLETGNAYQKGREYNLVLAEMEAQKALGWTSQIKTATVKTPGRLMTRMLVTVHDRAGAPVDGLKIRATMFRPVSAGADQAMDMTGSGGGHYEADFLLAYDGNWIARMAAIGLHGEKYVDEERVFIGGR